MAVRFKHPRVTRASLNTLAAGNGILQGEVYLITDENRLAVGLTTSTYEVFAKSSEASGGSPGGSNQQVQYNNSGAFGGAGHVDIDADGDLRIDDTSGTTNPSADQLKLHAARLAASGGRALLRTRSEDSVEMTLQSHFGRNSIAWAQASANSTTMDSNGVIALTALGTATARTPTTTNRFTRSRRIGYVTAAATAGSTTGYYNNSATRSNWTIGNANPLTGAGFFFAGRFGVSDPATVATAHMFFGLSSVVTAPSATVSPATLLNQIGVAQVSGGANLQLVYGGSAAQTAIDLGANFPAGSLSADLYELIIYASPGWGDKVAWRVERMNTGHVASGVIDASANPGVILPTSTTFLGPRFWRSNNTTALTVAMDILGYYIESEI